MNEDFFPHISGRPVGEDLDMTNTIKNLRQELHKVQHFIDHLNVFHLKQTVSKGK